MGFWATVLEQLQTLVFDTASGFAEAITYTAPDGSTGSVDAQVFLGDTGYEIEPHHRARVSSGAAHLSREGLSEPVIGTTLTGGDELASDSWKITRIISQDAVATKVEITLEEDHKRGRTAE